MCMAFGTRTFTSKIGVDRKGKSKGNLTQSDVSTYKPTLFRCLAIFFHEERNRLRLQFAFLALDCFVSFMSNLN